MKKLLAIILVLFSVNCFAEWSFVTSSTDKTIQIYVDFSTKKKVGGYIRVWSLVDTSRTFKKVHSYKVLEEFDCSLDRTRLIQMSAYSGRMGVGDVINTTKGDNSWDYIRPKTVEEDVFKRICS
jgi:hypothetical protein